MRLIDADKMMKDMKRNCVGNCLKCEAFTILSSNLHCGVIDRQPTAYDLEAVVEELEDGYECNVGKLKIISVDKAIEIVKRGGRNDSNT